MCECQIFVVLTNFHLANGRIRCFPHLFEHNFVGLFRVEIARLLKTKEDQEGILQVLRRQHVPSTDKDAGSNVTVSRTDILLIINK